MTTYIYSKSDAERFCNEQGAWRYAITGTGHDEDGRYFIVDQVRCFSLEEQQQLPFEFREPFNDELFDAWEEEIMEADPVEPEVTSRCHDLTLPERATPWHGLQDPRGSWPFPLGSAF